MFLLRHSKCQRPAFKLIAKPAAGDVVMAINAVLMDGTRAKASSEIMCGSCGARLQPEDISVRFVEQDG